MLLWWVMRLFSFHLGMLVGLNVVLVFNFAFFPHSFWAAGALDYCFGVKTSFSPLAWRCSLQGLSHAECCSDV